MFCLEVSTDECSGVKNSDHTNHSDSSPKLFQQHFIFEQFKKEPKTRRAPDQDQKKKCRNGKKKLGISFFFVAVLFFVLFLRITFSLFRDNNE